MSRTEISLIIFLSLNLSVCLMVQASFAFLCADLCDLCVKTGASVQKLGDGAVFQFELPDELVVMMNPADCVDDEIGTEQDQSGA